MSERTARAVLNDLIETCRDGARGLQNAAALIKDAALESLLLDLADERFGFAGEPRAPRAAARRRCGGARTAAAAMHRGWMDLKSVLTSHDDQAVMAEVMRWRASRCACSRTRSAGCYRRRSRLIEDQERRIRAGHARIEDAMQTARVHTP